MHFQVDNQQGGVIRSVDPFGWEAQPTPDPWPYNQGNLWAGGAPIPMGYRDEHGVTHFYDEAEQSYLELSDPDIRDAWFDEGLERMGAPISPPRACIGNDWLTQDFERGHIDYCSSGPPAVPTFHDHIFTAQIDGLHADEHSDTSRITIHNRGSGDARVSIRFYTQDGRILDSRVYTRLPRGAGWTVDVQFCVQAFLGHSPYEETFAGYAVVVSNEPLDINKAYEQFAAVARKDYEGPAGLPPPVPPAGYPPLEPPTSTPTPSPSPSASPGPSPTPTPTRSPQPSLPPTPGDTFPPVTTCHLQGSVGENGWHVSPVLVTLSATDQGSGVKSTYYRLDGQAWLEYTVPFLVHTEGYYPLEYYSVDYANNLEQTKSTPFQVDLTPPGSSASSPTCDNGSPIPVDWTAVDATSGVASTALWYRFDGGDWTDSGLRQGGPAGTFNFLPSVGDGTYYLATVATDNAGHQEAAPTGNGDDSTIYDTVLPSSAVNALPSCSPAVFEVSWAGTDPSPSSGIQSYDVQTCTIDCALPDDAVWVAWLTATTQTTAACSGAHGYPYYFRSRVRDNAGNQEDYYKNADAATVVDAIPPATAVNALPLDNPATTFTVTWSGSDNGCGLAHYDLYYRDESAAAWTTWLTNVAPGPGQAPFTGGAGHTYYFCSRGTDLAGNVEACPPLGLGAGEWPIQGDTETRIRPWSRVNALPAETAGTTIPVTWSGGPGLAVYDVQVRDGFYGPWRDWKSSFAGGGAEYTGQYGHIYCFRSRQRVGASGEVYPFDYDTYTKLIDITLGGAAPPAPALPVPPDEAPDRREEVTRTQVLGVPVVGYVAPAGDADWYRFEFTATMRVRVRLADLPADYDLYVFDGDGQFRGASTWWRLLPEEVVVRVPAGVYYVQLVGYAGAWNGATPYELLVAPASGTP